MILLFASCSPSGGFKKTKSGIVYKIISDKKEPLVKVGEFLKVDYVHKIRDSIMQQSYGGMPTYAPVDSVGSVYSPVEIFPMLRKGDSVVVVMLADSIYKMAMQRPPFVKKGDKLTLTFKVLDVLPNEDSVRADQEKQFAAEKEKEVKEIEQYLASKNIKAQKTEKGTFVEITEPGTGPAVDSGKAVHVMYTGQTFQGKVFDSNVDTTFGHSEPYVFVIGKRGAIEGWDDGLRLFNKGGKGRLYVPSMLAYGPNPPMGAPFKAFENLMFDVSVVDVTEPPATPARPMPGRNSPGRK